MTRSQDCTENRSFVKIYFPSWLLDECRRNPHKEFKLYGSWSAKCSSSSVSSINQTRNELEIFIDSVNDLNSTKEIVGSLVHSNSATEQPEHIGSFPRRGPKKDTAEECRNYFLQICHGRDNNGRAVFLCQLKTSDSTFNEGQTNYLIYFYDKCFNKNPEGLRRVLKADLSLTESEPIASWINERIDRYVSRIASFSPLLVFLKL